MFAPCVWVGGGMEQSGCSSKAAITVADLREEQGTPPLGSKFFHFHAVFGKKHRLAHPLWELGPQVENEIQKEKVTSIRYLVNK